MRLPSIAVLVVIALLLPAAAGAQDLGANFEKAREYVREMKERVRSSGSGSSESGRSESSRSNDDVASRERDAERERRRAEAEAERNRRRAEDAAARAANQRERQRVADNLSRLEDWLSDASSITPQLPPRHAGAPAAAVVAQRRREVEYALTSVNNPDYAIHSSRSTAVNVGLSEKIRLARGVQLRDAIVNRATVRLRVQPSNERAYPNEWYVSPSQEMVTRFDGWVREATRGLSLDPDLARAIIWMESTHGWYDWMKNVPSTVLPMNIHASFWQDLGVTRSDLQRPETNIRTGVRLLDVLWRSVEQPSVEKVATLYNDLGREAVSGYGKTVAHYYATKPWTTKR